MRFSKCRFPLIVSILAASLFSISASAFADSYQIFDMGGSGPIFGIDTLGDIVIFSPINSCDVNDNPCYFRFREGQIISFSTVAPQLNYDNGTPCVPNVPGNVNVSAGVCNNGREAFGATFPSVSGVFTGPDPVGDFIAGGSVKAIVLNARGDIAWTNQEGDSLEALDLDTQVPEPNTLSLLATGLLSVGVMAYCLGCAEKMQER